MSAILTISSSLVQAVRDGRKTQHRVPVEPQPIGTTPDSALDGKWLAKPFYGLLLPKIRDLPLECPYGSAGDCLDVAPDLALQIVSIWVERLQSISEAAALAEGCNGDCPVGYIPAHQSSPCVYHFAQLWESINGAGSWDANPWLWCIEFVHDARSSKY